MNPQPFGWLNRTRYYRATHGGRHRDVKDEAVRNVSRGKQLVKGRPSRLGVAFGEARSGRHLAGA